MKSECNRLEPVSRARCCLESFCFAPNLHCVNRAASAGPLSVIELPAKSRYWQHQSSCLLYGGRADAELHGNYSCLSQDLRRPEPQRFNIELSDLDISKEDLVEVFGHRFKA